MPPTIDPEIQSFYEEFRLDVETFERQLSKMMQDFPGQYVAIVKGKIIGNDASWEVLEKRTQFSHPNEFVFLERVAKEERVAVEMNTLEGGTDHVA